MRFTLKEYQNDAVGQMVAYFADARDDFHRKGRNISFSLSATTGAGKTVMAAAVIESLFFGNDDWNFDADPGAVVLWFTSDPSLNEQTRFRIMEAGDRIAHSRLQVIESSFNQEKFEPGKVYFLNSQKLGKNSLLVRGAPDESVDPYFEGTATPDTRAFTIWDTIKNTIEDDQLTLYLVLDEAHVGMKRQTSTDRQARSTIVKRLVNGANGVPPVPVVWGISATIDRFTDAMKEAEARYPYPAYEVDAALIQESGLLKDDIRLDFPAESGDFQTVLLKRATRKIKESKTLWDQYAAEQGSDADKVSPLLVVQMPNSPTEEQMRTAVDTIREEWPDLPADGIANVFGEHTDLEFGEYVVPYVRPETVQDREHIRVLFAKDAISTGWDCPRAEVLMSFRPAEDKTHITQLLGRMVRTPLARRVTGNDKLNSVECVLPFFNKTTANTVAELLLGTRGDDDGGDGSGGSGGGAGRRVLYAPVDMAANTSIPDAVWTAFDTLPSQTLPRKAAKPTKRLSALAQALSRDSLLPDARKTAYNELFGVLDGLLARYKDQVEAATYGILEVEGETIVAGVGDKAIRVSERFSEVADERSVEADFKQAQRTLSPDLASKYADRIAVEDGDDDGLFDAYIKVAALAQVDGVKDAVDREADLLANKWFDQYRVAIRGLSDERRAVYDEIIAMSSDPQRVDILRPKVRSEETQEADGSAVETRPRHLMADDDGNFPIGSLNGWETSVLDAEMDRGDALAWYRNPGRASDDSLAVAYKDGKGNWRRMCPDFIFFHGTESDVKVSIVDPHGFHLGDALPKLRGLADFAEGLGTDLHRIEAVAQVGDGTLRVLDLKEAATLQAIRNADDAEALYLSNAARNY